MKKSILGVGIGVTVGVILGYVFKERLDETVEKVKRCYNKICAEHCILCGEVWCDCGKTLLSNCKEDGYINRPYTEGTEVTPTLHESIMNGGKILAENGIKV